MSCKTCERWYAKTWEQYDNRMRNMRTTWPSALPHTCPDCGSVEWASTPPSIPRPEKASSGVLTLIAINGLMLAIILVAVLIVGKVAHGGPIDDFERKRIEMQAPQTRTFENSKGQDLGRSTTQGNRTIYKDNIGRETGRADRQQDGSTIYKDNMGREIGRERK